MDLSLLLEISGYKILLMSYCPNPDCSHPVNLAGISTCVTCQTQLVLAARYIVIKPIATGIKTRTLLAYDRYQSNHPLCVIKQFSPQGEPKEKQAIKLFHEEAIRLDEMRRHPQLANLLTHFDQEVHQYIVYEFVEGLNLVQEVKNYGAFNELQIRELLYSLLSLLNFIHHAKIIHRDIRPKNIIRHIESNQLVLVDFGAAQYAMSIFDKSLITLEQAGYISPEQSFAQAIPASDIFSLGVTCIYLLTLIEPVDLYEVSLRGFVWYNHVKNPISDQLKTIIDKMVQPIFKKRYQSAKEVLKDLSNDSIKTSITQSKTSGGISPNIKPTNFKLIKTLSGSKGAIFSVSISPDSKFLVSGSGCENSWLVGKDNTIRLWDVETGDCLYSFIGHLGWVRCVTFSPDGNMIASSSNDGTIKLWNLLNKTEIITLTGHTKPIYSVAFSPDGTLLVSGSGDQTIKLWDLTKLTLKRTIKAHSSSVYCVTFSPDGSFIASGSQRNIKLWDLKTGYDKRHLKPQYSIRAIAVSPCGHMLACASEEYIIKLWDTTNFKEIMTFWEDSAQVYTIAFSVDSKLLASGSDNNNIKIWDLTSGQELYNLDGHTNFVYSLTFSPCGQYLVSGSHDQTIKIWHLL